MTVDTEGYEYKAIRARHREGILQACTAHGRTEFKAFYAAYTRMSKEIGQHAAHTAIRGLIMTGKQPPALQHDEPAKKPFASRGEWTAIGIVLLCFAILLASGLMGNGVK